MQTVNDYSFDGKRALVRVDFNVPLNEKREVTDSTRIKAALPTINKILADGGSVVLMSHLGRPKRGEDEFSLRHIVSTLSNLLGKEVKFAGDAMSSEAVEMAKDLQPGEVMLLENLRFHREEKKGDQAFAAYLARMGDVYVNDAFGTAHRAHASTAVIAQNFAPENRVCGLLMAKEIESVQQTMEKGEKPFTAIIGGAKVSSKIGIIENLLSKIDNLIIGGGMTYTFIKAQGGNVGSSLVEASFVKTAKSVLAKAEELGVNVVIPVDSVVADQFSENANTKVTPSNDIPDGWMGLDIADEAIKEVVDVIESSKTILWNGPMGVFEMEKFAHGTKMVAYAVADATENGAFSLVGGGDSVAAVNKFDLNEKVSYVSTGGGALLELIEGKDLPGVVALQ